MPESGELDTSPLARPTQRAFRRSWLGTFQELETFAFCLPVWGSEELRGPGPQTGIGRGVVYARSSTRRE